MEERGQYNCCCCLCSGDLGEGEHRRWRMIEELPLDMNLRTRNNLGSWCFGLGKDWMVHYMDFGGLSVMIGVHRLAGSVRLCFVDNCFEGIDNLV
jgi:hypothetical protein